MHREMCASVNRLIWEHVLCKLYAGCVCVFQPGQVVYSINYVYISFNNCMYVRAAVHWNVSALNDVSLNVCICVHDTHTCMCRQCNICTIGRRVLMFCACLSDTIKGVSQC